MKKKILEELNNRISKLEKHKCDEKEGNGEFEQINHAISSLLNRTLKDELEAIKSFVEKC